MRTRIAANSLALALLILTVNANEKLDLKNGTNSKNEDSDQYAEGLIKNESENSAKPESGTLQKSMLLKNAAKAETGESPMKHVKLLAESENVSKHDSARHKVTSANDSTHNEAVSPPPLPLQNYTTQAADDTSNWPTTHAGISIKNITNHRLPITYEQSRKLIANGNNEDATISPPSLSNSSSDHLMVAAVHDESSTPSSNDNEQVTIGPFDLELVTDIVNSMLLASTDSDTSEAPTEAYPEDIVGVVVIEDFESDGIDGTTDQTVPETSTDLYTETLAQNPLLEAITLLDNLDLETTTPSIDLSSRSIDNFDFFVFDANSNVPCILLAMNVTVSIAYETKDQKYTTTDYPVPKTVAVSGHCANEHSSVTLSWGESSTTGKQNSISFDFAKDDSSFYVDSVHINIALDSHHFPNAKDAFIAGHSPTGLQLFSAPVQNGIHICPVQTKVTCGNIVASISNVTVIAYNTNQELSDRKEEYCSVASEALVQDVNVAGIIGGIVGAIITLAVVVCSISWCRRRTDITSRSELP